MRIILFLTIILLLFISIQGQTVTEEHHDDSEIHIPTYEDHEIAQPTTGRPTTTPTTPGVSPTRPTTPTRRTRTIPTTRRPRVPRTPRTTREPRRPGMTPRRPTRLTDMFRDPSMTPRLQRWMMLQRRMMMNMFRQLLQFRMRSMFGDMPMTRWERRMMRWMTLRDLMLFMDVNREDAQELASMIDEREANMDENTEDTDTLDETESEPETALYEPEVDYETEAEHEIEAVPEMEEEDIDPALIEAEFDIQAPYGGGFGGGYGGFGGGYGGFGGKKGGFGGGFGGKKGGFGGGFGGYGGKKVPFKKVPYKKVPIKKGGFGGGFGI